MAKAKRSELDYLVEKLNKMRFVESITYRIKKAPKKLRLEQIENGAISCPLGAEYLSTTELYKKTKSYAEALNDELHKKILRSVVSSNTSQN